MVWWVAEAKIVTLGHLLAQVIPATIRGIKTQAQTLCPSQVIGQRAPVAAQTCSVSYNALGIESYSQCLVNFQFSILESYQC